MWRLTRYLYAFAAGQAFEAWLVSKLERPSYAEIGQKVGAKLDSAADWLEQKLGENDST